MKLILSVALALSFASSTGYASPEEDLAEYRQFFKKRFPNLSQQDYADGVYAINPIARENWEAIEEFPPYELAIEDGEELFNAPFKNGKTYASCFKNGGLKIAQNYPYWDKERQEVVTLALAINECRVSNKEQPLPYKKGDIAAILAFMKDSSRGEKIQRTLTKDQPGAIAAYESGKAFFFKRRGQLNFACAHCHMVYSGSNLRSETLSPTIGHATNWPTYRAKWGEMGTIHRRFQGCNKQVRAKPLKAQSVAYRNLEFFLTYLSNDLEMNAPSSRR